ncbi:MAG: response regulator, partial [Chloroflexi bacterium]|nr:response regulator [Chloroflexota bacterium]
MGNDFRVLIIEDDVRTVRFIGAKLRAAGYVVEAVGNGNEAVDRLRSTDTDLVLLDLLLPGKNGLQVLSELRSFSKVPV